MQVIKRDGNVAAFQKDKIKKAILNAFYDVEGIRESEDAISISQYISESIAKKNCDLSVEEIQDIVEKQLMATKRKDVAKAYILYRSERTKRREISSPLIKRIAKRIKASGVENSNANVDEKSFSGREKEASSEVQKYMALELGGLSKKVANAHKEMNVYQHDLEKAVLGIHNCLNIDFYHIFENGFHTRNGGVRAPGSFSTACQLMAVAFQCQSQVQFGGVGTVHFDYDLAKYVLMSFKKNYKKYLKRSWCHSKRTKDKMIKDIDAEVYMHIDEFKKSLGYKRIYKYSMEDLEKEGMQALEGLYHNLNTLESRQGSQVPFTSINLGRDTSPEGRLINKWTFNASINGIGNNNLTSIFPISIFQYKRGTNAKKGNPNYDLKRLALSSMSKRIYPNWCNGDWSEAHEYECNPDTYMSTMG